MNNWILTWAEAKRVLSEGWGRDEGGRVLSEGWGWDGGGFSGGLMDAPYIRG